MIRKVVARKLLNSRGQPTIEVEVHGNAVGLASAPAGASAGTHEAVAFPKGVDTAVEMVNTAVAKALRGLDESNLAALDRKLLELDGQVNFSGKLGASAAIAISLAATKAAAGERPLFQYLNPEANKFPFPLGNVVGGGAHGGGTDIQEFLIIPTASKSATEAVFSNASTHAKLKEILTKKDSTFRASRNDEGGWVTGLETEAILESIGKVLPPGGKLGLDLAASQLWDGQKYTYTKAKKTFDPGDHLDFLLNLIKTYKLAYVEDPFHEEDFESFAELTKKAKGVLICADDLYVTQLSRLSEGLAKKSANSMIIKPNQNGLLSRTLEVMERATEAGLKLVVSHRSGETLDTSIAHLAVAEGALLLKTGVVGGERIAKLNELIRLWELADSPKMASW